MRVVQDWISPFTWMPSPTMRVPSEWDSSWGTFGSAFERPRTPAPGRTPRPSSDAGTRRRGWLVVVMAAFVLPIPDGRCRPHRCDACAVATPCGRKASPDEARDQDWPDRSEKLEGGKESGSMGVDG